MKVILSRKGFDSENGGYPSPILPDGRMVSLPIPVDDGICYHDLRFDSDRTYYDLMKTLKETVRCGGIRHELTKKTECHVDPDIYRNIMHRDSNWKPCFGQIGAAQTHLENQGVEENDLFLFFGWFRKTKRDGEKIWFHTDDRHVIFGYLQIGEIIKPDKNYREPEWMHHPHLLEKRRMKANNTIYIARDSLTWDSNIPGAGVFDFDQSLVLTKPDLTRSKWSLPDFFRKVRISHHSEKSWQDGYFQSATIGQEFVMEGSKNVEKWAGNLIEKNIRKQV